MGDVVIVGARGHTDFGRHTDRSWRHSRGLRWGSQDTSDENVSMRQVFSVLAKVKGEMSCAHRDSPEFQLLGRILDKARNRHEVEERAGSLLEQMLLCGYVSFFRPEGLSHDELWSKAHCSA